MLGSRSAYTRARIIEAAERLFAQKGHEKTSLREITAEAQVNLSSVNYHFGSKEGLIQAVRQQQLDALNQKRTELLDRISGNDEPVPPAEALKAFIGPLLAHILLRPATRLSLVPALERPLSDPGSFLGSLLSTRSEGATGRFLNLLARSFPHLPRQELLWRFQFMLGAIVGAIVGMDDLLSTLNRDRASTPDVDALCERLITFLAGGLSAPCPAPAGSEIPPVTPDSELRSELRNA